MQLREKCRTMNESEPTRQENKVENGHEWAKFDLLRHVATSAYDLCVDIWSPSTAHADTHVRGTSARPAFAPPTTAGGWSEGSIKLQFALFKLICTVLKRINVLTVTVSF
jgi:hypothetical protein